MLGQKNKGRMKKLLTYSVKHLYIHINDNSGLNNMLEDTNKLLEMLEIPELVDKWILIDKLLEMKNSKKAIQLLYDLKNQKLTQWEVFLWYEREARCLFLLGYYIESVKSMTRALKISNMILQNPLYTNSSSF